MTTESDINRQVLAAFQIEHREHLERIRSLLAELSSGSEIAGNPQLEDAFRRAHSLKGAARVCGLRPAEQLGHGLETVLEGLFNGRLRPREDVLATVNSLLDAVEDWMAAYESGQPPHDAQDVLEEVRRLIEYDQAFDSANRVGSDTIRRLEESFREEYAEKAQRLRELLASWAANDAIDESLVVETERLLHSLAGAAEVVGQMEVAQFATALESSLRRIHCGEQQPDGGFIAVAQNALRRMDAVVHRETSCDDQGASARTTKPVVGRPAALPAVERGDSSSAESVRIGVASLQRLNGSADQLLVEVQRQAGFGRELAQLQGDIDQLKRQHELVRRDALGSRHRLRRLPEFEQLSRHLEYVDRQVHVVARKARRLCQRQRRGAWAQLSRAQQIRLDVRAATMVTAESVLQGLRMMVRNLADDEGKHVELRVIGFDVRADRMVLQALKDPLMHMLRNCISHGIETAAERARQGKPQLGLVELQIDALGSRLQVTVNDDGRGVDLEQLKRLAEERGLLRADSPWDDDKLAQLVFEQGLTTTPCVTELAGRGLGLSVVRDVVARLQGEVRLVAKSECGAKFQLSVPMTVTTCRLLLVSAAGQTFAIPMRDVERLLRVRLPDLETLEGRPVVAIQGRLVPLTPLAETLGLRGGQAAGGARDLATVVIVKNGKRLAGLVVDAAVDQREALVKGLDRYARRAGLAGAVLMDDDSVVLVINAAEMPEHSQPTPPRSEPGGPAPAPSTGPSRVLVVDDSFTTRTLEKSLLEAHGYEVDVVVDGAEALARLRTDRFDLVISDVEMPKVDGFALLEKIRADRRLSKIPVILVTSRDTPEDQQRGLTLGADAYILKRKFDHCSLLNTVKQLL